MECYNWSTLKKPFYSISWNFLYAVINIFGYTDDFIKWIKLFNNDIVGSVIQCGFLSDPFNIKQGARQGDPISPYLFIICAEILAILFTQNPKIKGITISNNQYKITQFADDTSLLLDDSKESLQVALNVLEIYGSMSGLKMNSDKTKVVWIGRKKFSKDKLQINAKLKWGETQFDLLGYKYSLELDKIVDLNFNQIIDDIKKAIFYWNKRHLTPLGKITVIKTFLLWKINNLLLQLPNPPLSTTEKITKCFYKFIWEGKPDKIKRTILCQSFETDRLQMINIQNHASALKSSWIRQILNNNNSQWITLFNDTIYKIDNLAKLGTKSFYSCSPQIENKFWKGVFRSWYAISVKNKVQTKDDILSMPLWYSPTLSEYILFYPKWHKAGINFIGDLLESSSGNILTLNQINSKYKNYYKFPGLSQNVYLNKTIFSSK